MKERDMATIQEIDYGTPKSKAEKMVNLTIDGVKLAVPEGTSIMRAAMEMGTQIPKLCATDMVEAFGSCRLCLVEIEGRNGTPASCTTPVAEGMAVKTQTERLKRLRKGVMELYISEHPLDCLTCSANGDCELQDMAGAVGLREVRYGYDGQRHPNPGIDASNPYFTYEPSKCIVCSRCVRACAEVHVRADHRRTRLRLGRVAVATAAVPRFGVRLVRRLCPGMPSRNPKREERDRDWHTRACDRHHLRLLRRGLCLQGRDARR